MRLSDDVFQSSAPRGTPWPDPVIDGPGHDPRFGYVEQFWLGILGATLALTSGVPLKVVSDMLGHASVAITGDVYSHVTETMAEDPASKVAALLR